MQKKEDAASRSQAERGLVDCRSAASFFLYTVLLTNRSPKRMDRESLIKMGGGGVSVGPYWCLMKSCVEFHSFIRKDKDTNFLMQ